MKIDRIDHVVLTANDLDRTIDFYTRVMGMEPITFAGGRRGLAFGRQKLNLHQAGREYEPKALKPTPARSISASSPRHRLKRSSRASWRMASWSPTGRCRRPARSGR